MAEDDYWSPRDSGGLLGDSGGGWLGNLLNFSGGRSTTADIYGDLFTKKQLAAIQQRESQAKLQGLLGVLSQAAAPSEFKKNYGQILGQAGAAMMGAEGGDKAALAALGGQKTAAQIAQLRQAAASKAAYSRAIEELYSPGGPLSGVRPPPGAAPAPAPAPPTGTPTAPSPGPTPDAPAPSSAGAPVNPFAPPPIPYAGPFSAPARRPFGMGGAPGAGSAGTPVNGPSGVRDDNPDSPTYGQYVLPPTPPSGPDLGAGAGIPVGLDPNQQFAGLLGGGPQLPPTEGEEDALPPQDTVIPGGQAGLLDPDMVKLAALGGGSGGGRDPLDIIAQYESGNRNIMQQVVPPGGGYNPSVGRVTGPSTAQGPWMITNTTWKGAAPKVGIDPKQYPNAMSLPVEEQRKVAQQLYNERGYADWAPYNRALAREVGWKGAQYTEGSGGGSGPSGGGAPPAAGGGGLDDPIPGIGLTMRDIARIDALAGAADEPSPFKTLLDAHYKSPAYLGQAETARQQAQSDVQLKMDPLIREQTERAALRAQLALKPKLDAAIERAKNAPLAERKEAEAEVDRLTKAYEQYGAARYSSQETTVTLPGQRPEKKRLTNEQIYRLNKGEGVPEIGLPAGTKIGEPVYSPTETALGPIEAKDIFEKKQAAVDAAAMVETNKEARKLLDDGVITGFAADKVTAFTKLGNALGITGRNSQEQVANTEAYIATTAGNVGRMIKQFGAGTGLSDSDREYAAQMVAGKIALDETSIRRILDINDRASVNIINRHNKNVSTIREGATMTDLKVPVPEPYKTSYPEGTVIRDASGKKMIRRDGKWEPHL